jgi:cystathionine beta-synthase
MRAAFSRPSGGTAIGVTMEIYDNILDTLGNTPLVKLGRFFPGPATLAAKLEYFNPGGSVKDRIGIAMIEAGERAGLLKPGGTIVEPTSGNTGVGLAMAANLRGYKLICTAPDKIPQEKIALLEALGATVLTCPTNVEADDPRSYYKVAERIRDEQGAYLPYQYYNQANPDAHYRSTGPEIWRQTSGKVTHYVVGVGTGGTISGTAKYLKEQNPAVQVIGVDTVGSVYKYYFEHRQLPPADQIHQYLIDGIGEDFLPSCVWWDYIDGIVTVDDHAAYTATMDLARQESIFVGSSSGAAAAGARQVAEQAGKGALVVTLFPDSGERYLSKLNKKWMGEKGLLD